MIIEIPDELIAKQINKLPVKHIFGGRSGLEEIVEEAIKSLAKNEVIKLLKHDSEMIQALRKNVEENCATAVSGFTQTLARYVVDGIEEKLRHEFGRD